MASLFLLAGVLVVSVLAQAFGLYFGARLLRAGTPGLLRSVLTVLALAAVGFAASVAGVALRAQLPPREEELALAAVTGAFAIQVVLSWLVIRVGVRTGFGKAALLMVFEGVVVAGLVALMFLVVRPYLVEAFVVPTNSMSPTVCGWHYEVPCPRCGGILICPAPPPGEDVARGWMPAGLGICENCLKTSEVELPPPDSRASNLHTSDRILANKLLAPQRWDMIVFVHPKEPSQKYLKRLVGLPGEVVSIRDGAVWINGERQTPPGHLARLEYTLLDEIAMGDSGGPPWRLGPDECFALGDFSAQAADGRFFGPVPLRNVEGVADLCYYRLGRWRVFR